MRFKIFMSNVQSEFVKARLAIAEMVRKDRLFAPTMQVAMETAICNEREVE